jgi:hypothetical protein
MFECVGVSMSNSAKNIIKCKPKEKKKKKGAGGKCACQAHGCSIVLRQKPSQDFQAGVANKGMTVGQAT